MRRVPIRLKLAAALSIPLLALGVVTVLEVLKSGEEVDQVREQTQLAEAAIGPAGLITTLQNERTWAAVDLIGQAGAVAVPVSGYEETRADTNEAAAEFRRELESKDESIQEAFKPALDGLATLEQLRADIDNNVATVPVRSIANNIGFSHPTFQRYTELIEPFFDATTRISLAIDDPELRQGTELADAATRQIEMLSLLLNNIIGSSSMSEGGLNTSAEITDASVLHADFQRYAAIMEQGSGPYARIADEHYPSDLVERVNQQASQAILHNSMDLAVMLDAVNTPMDENFVGYQAAVYDEIRSRSKVLNDSAQARQRWFMALAVLVIGVASVLTWLVSRSITKPLRSLTRQAREMAERRLPDAVLDILETPLGDDVVVPTIEPVRLNTRDEVADVSEALNTVQDTALDLAVEQAVLRRNIADSFVNLGRRNQNLLGRQLDFITELETNETDPDTLANLFRLDHLATRMRRNAESLLVLAGIEPPRKWAAPVRLTDVIRAALGEVEDYQRVTVRGVEPATILGSAAADLAHLLAELIENALVFSPPDQSVDIRGRNRPDGYTLAIIDSGLGMPPTDIAAANRRLAGAESFTIAPSKYLGHYVAGNLAARHNIHVHLDNSPGNGITATIDLPPTLLTTDTALPHPDEPHAARDIWPPVPDGPAQLDAPPTAPFQLDSLPAPAGTAAPAGPAGAPAFPRASFNDTAPPANRGVPAGADAPAWYTTPPPAAAQAPDPAAPAGESRRTPSGLVKRTPRVVDTGEMPALPRGASDDLLATLSRYTNSGRIRRTGEMPALPSRQPSAEQAPPPLPSRGNGATAPPPLPARDSGPAAPPPASTGLGLGGGLAAGLSGLSPFAGRPATPPPGSPPPGGPASSSPPPGPAANGPTNGGLTRRVRGAQMPTAKPLSIRRAPGAAPADGPAPAVTPPPRTAEQKQSADAVYSFLSSFSAGVQRGLDDTRSRRPPQG